MGPEPERDPTVSVIIPTYNRARLVTEAIDSVLAQTFTDYEIIVVDDGSTDGTGDLLRARYGDHIGYVYQENAGPGEARNRGIAHSKGQYLAFLDSDDLWARDRLERQLDAASACGHGPVLWFADSRWESANGDQHTSEWEMHGRFRPEAPAGEAGVLARPNEILVRGYVINMSTVLVKKSVLEDVGWFRKGQRESEDLDCFVRLARVGAFGYINRSLCVRGVHRDNTDFHTVRALRERERIFAGLSGDRALSSRAQRAAARNWRAAVKGISDILRREGKPDQARQEILGFPGWWRRPGLVVGYVKALCLGFWDRLWVWEGGKSST